MWARAYFARRNAHIYHGGIAHQSLEAIGSALRARARARPSEVPGLRLVEPEEASQSLLFHKTKNAPFGAFVVLAEKEGFEPSIHL
jgi:hypothetical protein